MTNKQFIDSLHPPYNELFYLNAKEQGNGDNLNKVLDDHLEINLHDESDIRDTVIGARESMHGDRIAGFNWTATLEGHNTWARILDKRYREVVNKATDFV